MINKEVITIKNFNTNTLTKNPEKGGNPAKLKKLNAVANFNLKEVWAREDNLLIPPHTNNFNAINNNHP